MSDISRPTLRAQEAIAEYVAHYSDGSPDGVEDLVTEQVYYTMQALENTDRIIKMVMEILAKR